jgi:hypothetical protein
VCRQVTPSTRRAAAWYDLCLTAADACERRPFLLMAVGAPLIAACLTTVGIVVLQDFPNSGDEYAYLYQAATMAEGRVTNPLPDAPEFFDTLYIAQDEGRAYGTFPIGWPLLLAAAMRAGVPTVVVNPLLGVLTLLLVFLVGRELYGPRVGVLAMTLTAICPFFVLNAASYFSHTLCGCLLLGAAFTAALAARRHPAFALATGFLIGWAVLARYLTGAVAGAAILVWLMRNGRGRRTALAVLFAAGGVPWVLLLAWYNTALTGSAWSLTTETATISNWFADGFLTRGPDILATQILRLVLWTPPLLMAVYVVYLRRSRLARRHREFEWLLVIVAGTLFFYVNRGGNQYGPRFYYEATLFALLFTTANLFAERGFQDKGRRERWAWLAAAASVAVVPVLMAVHLQAAGEIVRERQDPYLAAGAAGLDNAVVLLSGRIGTQRSMDARDLTRNDFAYKNRVLFALDLGVSNCEVAAAFPGKSLYRYTWNSVARQGELTALRC